MEVEQGPDPGDPQDMFDRRRPRDKREIEAGITGPPFGIGQLGRRADTDEVGRGQVDHHPVIAGREGVVEDSPEVREAGRIEVSTNSDNCRVGPVQVAVTTMGIGVRHVMPGANIFGCALNQVLV